MQKEGMKFYTNFILLGKHNSGGKASDLSVTKQIENIMVEMYQGVEEAK